MEVYSKFRVVLVPAEHKKPLCLVQGKLGLRFLVLLHLMPLMSVGGWGEISPCIATKQAEK